MLVYLASNGWTLSDSYTLVLHFRLHRCMNPIHAYLLKPLAETEFAIVARFAQEQAFFVSLNCLDFVADCALAGLQLPESRI